MQWFGEDGRLLALPDPVKEISSRPPIIDDDLPKLTTPYKYVSVSLVSSYSYTCSTSRVSLCLLKRDSWDADKAGTLVLLDCCRLLWID